MSGPVFRLDSDEPQIHESAWVAPNATVIGKVTLGPNSSVWFGAVVRGDESVIRIGRGTNIQDGCVLHGDPASPLTVGDNCTIGHKVILHGCTVQSNTLIVQSDATLTLINEPCKGHGEGAPGRGWAQSS